VRTALHKPIGQVPLPLELDIAALHSDTGQLEGLVHNRNQSNRKKKNAPLQRATRRRRRNE